MGPITASKDIPVQWQDFPFSAIGEQFGLVGGAVVAGLFLIMLLRIWRIAHMSRDLFGTYLCAGAFTMLLWQLFQNVAMTVGVMPITGLPLPFISYGGSSLVAFFVRWDSSRTCTCAATDSGRSHTHHRPVGCRTAPCAGQVRPRRCAHRHGDARSAVIAGPWPDVRLPSPAPRPPGRRGHGERTDRAARTDELRDCLPCGLTW